jgi:hypothetical protein
VTLKAAAPFAVGRRQVGNYLSHGGHPQRTLTALLTRCPTWAVTADFEAWSAKRFKD